MAYDYTTITTRLERAVLFATFDNPPANIITLQMFLDLVALANEIERDDAEVAEALTGECS